MNPTFEPRAPRESRESREPRRADVESDTISPFIPMLILGLVLAAWFGFQAVQLRAERSVMTDLLTNQEKQVQDSKKLRDSLDAIAKGTAQLAAGGNSNAKLILDELKKRGITISPNAGQTGATPAEPAK